MECLLDYYFICLSEWENTFYISIRRVFGGVAKLKRNAWGSKVLTWCQTLKLCFRGHQIHISTRLGERNASIFSYSASLLNSKVIRDKHLLEKRYFLLKPTGYLLVINSLQIAAHCCWNYLRAFFYCFQICLGCYSLWYIADFVENWLIFPKMGNFAKTSTICQKL